MDLLHWECPLDLVFLYTGSSDLRLLASSSSPQLSAEPLRTLLNLLYRDDFVFHFTLIGFIYLRNLSLRDVRSIFSSVLLVNCSSWALGPMTTEVSNDFRGEGTRPKRSSAYGDNVSALLEHGWHEDVPPTRRPLDGQ